jgi:hypothetical protein
LGVTVLTVFMSEQSLTVCLRVPDVNGDGQPDTGKVALIHIAHQAIAEGIRTANSQSISEVVSR